MTEQELLQEPVVGKMESHAISAYPNEACGLLVRTDTGIAYMPCRNISDKPGDYFAISAEDYRRCEDTGEIVGVFHSHPNEVHTPSDQDLASCQRSKLPWVIYSWPAAKWGYTHHDLAAAPLYGREFRHGSFDCFGFVQAWLKQERGIELDTPVREDRWWENGKNLYLDNYEKWGFVPVPLDQIKVGDVLLMQVMANVPNHAAVLVDDGVIGHHMYGRLSSRDVYGGYWRRHTTHAFRHKDLMQ